MHFKSSSFSFSLILFFNLWMRIKCRSQQRTWITKAVFLFLFCSIIVILYRPFHNSLTSSSVYARWKIIMFFYERKKNFDTKVKISTFYENIRKNVKVFILTDTLAKMSTKYFCRFFRFRIFFSLKKKIFILVAALGLTPSSVNGLVCNIFFYRFFNGWRK